MANADFDETQYLVAYESEDSDDEGFSAPTAKRKRGKGKFYDFKADFESFEEAESALKAQGKWTLKRSGLYKCSVVFGAKCPVSVRITLPDNHTGARLLKSLDEHNHNRPQTVNSRIPQDIRIQINNLLELGIDKPQAIINKLQTLNLPIPTKVQLNNYLVKKLALFYNYHFTINLLLIS